MPQAHHANKESLYAPCHFATLIATVLPTPSIAGGSLEEGMTELARQIVEKTSSDQTVTIGISTFPHADNTCSELSNYMADLLVVSMFDVGSGKVQIVDSEDSVVRIHDSLPQCIRHTCGAHVDFQLCLKNHDPLTSASQRRA